MDDNGVRREFGESFEKIMKIMKFGGTSLGDATRMKNVATIVSQGEPVLVVLSAIAGTTDMLHQMASNIKKGEAVEALQCIKKLKTHYKTYVESLFFVKDENNSQFFNRADHFLEQQFEQLKELIQQKYIPAVEYHLMARGEMMSTELFFLYLQFLQQPAALINALDFLRLNENSLPDEVYLEMSLNKIIKQQTDGRVFITQGYICRNAFGEITNLKRGGSDYSASLFGAAIDAEEIQIWTDIDGMHNNDPRFVKGTHPIRELSFDEAAELAYFGAKILHPASIKPARRKNIAVKLLNTMQPEARGTLISSQSTQARIKAIAAKDGITAIKIRSSEMLQAPGFLRRIFEVFELYQTSIDMITTSEVAVSVTIDDENNLSAIVETLNEFGHVEVDKYLTIICVVGDFVVDNKGIAAQVIQSLDGIAIRMISYGGSAHNISILVSEADKKLALNLLHKGLFNAA